MEVAAGRASWGEEEEEGGEEGEDKTGEGRREGDTPVVGEGKGVEVAGRAKGEGRGRLGGGRRRTWPR